MEGLQDEAGKLVQPRYGVELVIDVEVHDALSVEEHVDVEAVEALLKGRLERLPPLACRADVLAPVDEDVLVRQLLLLLQLLAR